MTNRVFSEQLNQFEQEHGAELAKSVRELADQEYGSLVASISHDIRSVLTTLSINTQMLVKELGPQKRLRSIQEDIERLIRTFESMEQYSRHLPIQCRQEPLRELLILAVDHARDNLMQQGYGPSNVRVRIGGIAAIRLNVTRRLVILALTYVIQNAFESFVDRDSDVLGEGLIDLKAIVDESNVHIVVTDTGPGMEPEVLRRLSSFVPLGRNRSKRKSSGWGMSLAHKYITAHGGSVSIESKLNSGTTVVITLPISERKGKATNECARRRR